MRLSRGGWVTDRGEFYGKYVVRTSEKGPTPERELKDAQSAMSYSYQINYVMRLLLAKFFIVACVRHLLRLVKNYIKTTTGRKPVVTDEILFFRRYLAQLIIRRPLRKLTCLGLPGEGPCSQALFIISALNFARATGVYYAHTPFVELSHADRPMCEWAAAWESYFNLGSGESYATEKDQLLNYSQNYPYIKLCFGWSSLGITDFLDALIPELRHKYYLNNAPRSNELITVAVHVRRGDVTAEDHKLYFTDMNTVFRTTSAVRSILDAHDAKYRISLHSQGSESDFVQLASLGVEMFLDADPIWTHKELVEADILITARGTFSFTAGLISDGIILCEPYRYSLPTHWIRTQPDGSFDKAAFIRKLLSILTRQAGPARTMSLEALA